MKKRETLGMAVLTSRPINNAAQGAAILRQLASFPELAPQKFGLTEPLHESFELANIETISKEFWVQDMFYWSRKNPTSSGGVRFGNARLHSRLNVSLSDEKLVPVLVRYLRCVGTDLLADFGYIEATWEGQGGYFGPMDQFNLRTSPEAFEHVPGNFSTVEMLKYLGQLPWATIFGPPYVQRFGREKLLSAPAAIVEEIAPGMIYLQLTPKVEDVAADSPAYFTLRRRIKEHIGPDAFFDPVKGKGPYRAPKFDLEPWGKPKPLGFIDGKPVIGLFAGKPIVQTDDGPRVLDKQWLPSNGSVSEK
jgi:hypothetical protein